MMPPLGTARFKYQNPKFKINPRYKIQNSKYMGREPHIIWDLEIGILRLF